MGTIAVTSWKYNASTRYLKIFYADGSASCTTLCLNLFITT